MRFLLSWMIFGLFLTSPVSAGASDHMPGFLAGKTFSAAGHQADGQEWFADYMFANVKDPDVPSKVISKTVDCEADMFAIESTDSYVIFKQRTTKGMNICPSLGYVKVEDNPLTGLIILTYSDVRTMHPVGSKAVLHEKNKSLPTQDRMKEITKKYAPIGPTVVGSYQLPGSWTTPGCETVWDREDRLWLPYEPRGALTIWSYRTEEGGHVYAAWADDSAAETVRWTELKHVNKGSFVAKKGLLWIKDKPVYLEAEPIEGKSFWNLIIAPEGANKFSLKRAVSC